MNTANPVKKIKIILAVFFSLLVMMGFFSATYTVETGTVGILSTFGKYQEDPVLPGLHIKIPVIQTVRILDIKLQSANYIGRQDIPDKRGVINKPYISVLDNKNLPIGIDLTVMYTPDANEGSNILGKYGVNYFDKVINPNIRDVVRDVVGKYPAEKIASDRSVISSELRVRIDKKFETLPFVLNEVSLRNIQLPKIVLKKVEEVQIAKQEEQKLAMVENQAKKKQKIQTIQANTRLIEVTTKAKAEAEKQKIAADAKAYQLKVEAEAIAEANNLIAKSITDELIRYKSIEKWTGMYPKLLMQGSDTNTILQLPKLDD
ncbi:MAG: prohibitin family protein [gamma proteobacterium symbiont of Taylorina sp.]|nr:prohibitin family protein [gamma proteobacterium symbiont of Taylorina sp.]